MKLFASLLASLLIVSLASTSKIKTDLKASVLKMKHALQQKFGDLSKPENFNAARKHLTEEADRLEPLDQIMGKLLHSFADNVPQDFFLDLPSPMTSMTDGDGQVIEKTIICENGDCTESTKIQDASDPFSKKHNFLRGSGPPIKLTLEPPRDILGGGPRDIFEAMPGPPRDIFGGDPLSAITGPIMDVANLLEDAFGHFTENVARKPPPRDPFANPFFIVRKPAPEHEHVARRPPPRDPFANQFYIERKPAPEHVEEKRADYPMHIFVDPFREKHPLKRMRRRRTPFEDALPDPARFNMKSEQSEDSFDDFIGKIFRDVSKDPITDRQEKIEHGKKVVTTRTCQNGYCTTTTEESPLDVPRGQEKMGGQEENLVLMPRMHPLINGFFR